MYNECDRNMRVARKTKPFLKRYVMTLKYHKPLTIESCSLIDHSNKAFRKKCVIKAIVFA